VVLDFSRHLGRVHDIDPGSRTAVVDPGVTLDSLQRLASPHRLRFGPEPSTHDRCTIGGMIGNNACGSRALGYGRTADSIVEVEMVTGGGELLTVGPGAGPQSVRMLAELDRVVRSRLAVIRTEFGRFGRQVSGYSLEHLLPERGFDVARAFAGSEGTWGILTRAAVRLVPAPACTALIVLGYPDMAAAADAAPSLLKFSPVAVEGLDSRIVDVVRQRKGGYAVPELPRGSGWLFVEIGGDDPAEVEERATAVIAGAAGEGRVAGRREAAALWKIREDGAGLAASMPGRARVLAGWEDAAVPPEHLGSYLRDFEELLAGHGLSGVPYGHFGDGCVHVRIDFPLASPSGRSVFRDFLTDAARLVARYGGSMSGEHGDGRARSELLPLMYSPAALDALAAVKDVFDPGGLLNPGVIVRPRAADDDLRLAGARPLRAGLGFAYHDDGGNFTEAVHRCTGVGKCRATSVPGVMCPSYRATRDEKDSTRGRARILQELANGSLVAGWRSPEVLESLDLCLSCKACASECPAGVDMAAYKAEALYQRYRRRVRPPAHYSLGQLPRWSRLAARMPGLANKVLTGALAPAAKRIAGIDARRSLPPFAAQTFRQWFAGRPAAPGSPVALWVDTFTDHFSPEVGVAAVRVLENAGFAVTIPGQPACCGLTWISTGQLSTARRVLGRGVAALRPLADAGIPIVGLEPSCTAVFRGDAAELLGRTPEVTAVAAAVKTLSEFLASVPGWLPPDLAGMSAVVQPHCHHRAVLGFSADQALLERAGIHAQVVDGCCGLAGNFGAERGHYDLSVAVASAALLPAVDAAGPAAPVLADGFSCRTQLSHLRQRKSMHLAQLLAARAGTPVSGESGPRQPG
jgi:FAD/FMN-containing dehydrogenase/Fe-S oxidoreductase